MANFILQNKVALALGGYALFSIMVTALPEKKADLDMYTYWRQVGQAVAGALSAKLGSKNVP